MKRIAYVCLFASALMMLNSCGNGLSPEAEKARQDSIDKVKGRDLYLKAVEEAEKNLHNDKNFDPKKALAAMKAYNDFAVTYPKDTLTPEYLFRASDLAQGTGNYQQATVFLEQIIGSHTEYRKYVDACFVCAFVYDSYLENTPNGSQRAKELYQFVINKFPESSYAGQAKTLLEYLGKPDSVMLNDILRKNNVK